MANKRKVQEINAGSMADIAFLLLIFFLVATTMNVDSGINRVLPPWSDNQDQDAPDIKERNLMQVYVNAYDQIMAKGEPVDITQLTDVVKEFVLNPNNDENLPEKESVEIDLIGSYPVSQGVISLTNDRGTSYEMYIKVQNELTRAFNEIRNDLANTKFSTNYADLTEEQRNVLVKAVPNKISEAEPKNIGGN